MNIKCYKNTQTLSPHNIGSNNKSEHDKMINGADLERDEGITLDYSPHDVEGSTNNVLVRKMVYEDASLSKCHRSSFSDSGYSSCSSATSSPEPRNFVENRYMVPQNMEMESPSTSTIPHENQLKVKKPEKECHVCGEMAHGNFFGAIVCLPCKTFFIRCTTEDASTFICRHSDGKCDVTGINRSRCKYCRYQKCLHYGMNRKERPEQVIVKEGQQLCRVCGDVANGVHFGVISCEGCKKFFRRGLRESDSYMCKVGTRCTINPRTRNDCRFCRFEKCKSVGMSTSAIKMGRPKKAEEVVTKKRPMSEHDNGDMPKLVPLERKPFGDDLPHPFMYPHFMQQYQPVMQHTHRNNTDSIINSSISPPVVRRLERLSPILNSGDLIKHSVISPKINYKTVTEDVTPPIKRPKIEHEDAYAQYSNLSSHIGSANAICDKTDKSNINHFPQGIKSTMHVDKNCDSNKCVIIKEEVIDLHYEESSIQKHQVSPSADILPTHFTPRDSDSNHSNHEQFLTHKYDGGYWNLLSHQYKAMSPMCESQRKLVNNLAVAYLELIEKFCKAPLSQNNETENEVSQKRFIHYISSVINFMRTIPGFTKMHEEDKYTVLRLGAIQVCAVVASIHLYNPVLNCFIKSFFEENLEPDDPAHNFQKALLSLARYIHSLNLDNMEAAFLCALLTLATDWPGLKKRDQIEMIQNELLCTLKSYISMKYGEKPERINSMFSIVPTLRKLGIWHYKISYESSLT